MTTPLIPLKTTHESLDRTEALLLASLERMGRNPAISRTTYSAAKAATAEKFKAIDVQRVRLLAMDRLK